MQLAWSRPKSDLTDVLISPNANGPEIAYWIFNGITEKNWENMTVLAPGKYGKEFNKTYGHYHPKDTLETSKFISGDGLYLLQKKHIENKVWIDDMVDEVYLVKFNHDEELTIPSEFGHSWSNVGNLPLLVYDDWRIKHSPTDYQSIKKLKGMCFYLVDDNGIKFIPNPNYKNHPEPKIVTVDEFQQKYPCDL